MSVFDHPVLSGLFGDPDMAALWSAQRQVHYMLQFEAAWSLGLGQIGRVSKQQAETAARAVQSAEPDMAALAGATARDGVPVPELVRQLQALGPAEAIHKGATSQDVMDTALALTLRDCFPLLQTRLSALIDSLEALERAFGDAALMGRTRMQAATPITVTDRVQSWRLPLVAHRDRLDALAPRVLRVQYGGASGNRAELGAQAPAMAAFLAEALDLAATDKAWHAMRDGVAECASVFSQISGSLGKIGQDAALMAQQGLDELTIAGGGGSSAMPHKQNPVLAELLVTLARFNAVQVSGMHQALVHEQERSGAAWSLEWMILPQMALATGRGLTAALALIADIRRIGAPQPL